MKKGLTELVFVLDKSGSMWGLESDSIGGYNSMLKKQSAQEGECNLTTILFNENVEVLHDRLNIKSVAPLSESDYVPGGGTALIDAIGLGIDKIVSVQRRSSEDYRAEHVVFVIITDGMENSSRKYTSERVKAMIEHEKEKYGWEFIFLGANIDAVETAGRFGIGADRAIDYVCDSRGTALNYSVMADAVSSVRSGGHIDEGCFAPIRADMKERGGKKAKR